MALKPLLFIRAWFSSNLNKNTFLTNTLVMKKAFTYNLKA